MIPVIIVTHNNSNTIKFTIRALKKSRFKYDELQIVVIDNFSTDNTLQILRNLRDDYTKVIALKKNVGFPMAVMIGLLTTKPDSYFALLNPDAIPTPHWLERLYEVMEGDRKIGMAQSLLVHPDGSIDSAGGFLNFLGYPKEAKGVLDHRPYDVFYGKGAAVLIRVSAYREAGGFDPRFFFYYDETDLCARMRKLGYRIVVVPSSIVFHVGLGSAIECKQLFVYYYMERNRLLYLFKNNLLSLPIGLATALIGAVKERGVKRAIRLKAIGDFYRLLRGKEVEEPFKPCQWLKGELS